MDLLTTITQLLDKLLDPEARKEVEIKDNQICINGTPIGDYRLASNFRIENNWDLGFHYNEKERVVHFGLPKIEKRNCVYLIWENGKLIYDRSDVAKF